MHSTYAQYINLLQIARSEWRTDPRCVICGISIDSNSNKREHVPPQGIYVAPISNQLLTVPCCEDCNNGTSYCDREFKYSLALYCEKFASNRTRSGRKFYSALSDRMLGITGTPLSKKLKGQLNLYFKQPGIYRHHQWWPTDAHDTIILKILCGLFWLYRGGEILTDRAYRILICREIDFNAGAANEQIGQSYPGINIANGQFIAQHTQSFDTCDSIYSGVFGVSMHFHCDMKLDHGYHVAVYCLPIETIEGDKSVSRITESISKMKMITGKVGEYEVSKNEIGIELNKLLV